MIKLIIKIPPNNIPERTYIIDILIGEFLGVSYSIEISETPNYLLIFEGKEIIVEDHFFGNYREDLSYLKMEAIPKDVVLANNQFTSESNVPVLFGNDQLIVGDNNIMCGNDIFAASFFMLTRWEEYVHPTRDHHNRFSAKDSLAYKFDFLDRPIVNEYVEMLWNMLKNFEFKEERKKREYKFILTHDVDHLRYYNGIKSVGRKIAGDIVKRKRYNTIFSTLKEYHNIKKGIIKDPYDTFDWIMDLSEKVNIQSRFYFMSDNTTDKDNRYDIKGKLARSIIENIKGRGHIVGFHPGIDSCNDTYKWTREKRALEEVVNKSITEGRQHYLKFEAPFTYRIWESNNMKKDYTVGYHDKEGFRCGVCFGFSVFDFIEREKLNLLECSLTVMEATMHGYQEYSAQEMKANIRKLINVTKKYQGNFVFLWHNSSFNTEHWKGFDEVYEEIIVSIKQDEI